MPQPFLYTIRPMGREEIPFAVELAAREGWNPGLHDEEAFYRADPAGFLVGCLGDTPVGCISAVSYGGSFGFIGFYIVVPEQRGKGYGIRLWNAALEHLAGHVVGLDGVVAQQDNYRKSGFRLAYSNIRFEGSGISSAPAPSSIVPLDTLPFDSVAAYDRRHFPAERRTFLEEWLKMPESLALCWMENGVLRGYGVIRRCRAGRKIGPLFADDGGIAEQLYLALSSGADGPVYLDVPEVNEAGMALAEKYAMVRVFGTARMYTGEAPALPLEQIFGVTTFELG
jgi:GNAT superfamily N-acetyltransferase